MRRQRHTAELVCAALASAGLATPDIITDERWNEFNLVAIYQAFAGRLKEESAEFARDLEAMQEALIRDPHTTGGATGRCDAAVVRAWIANRYPDYEGESWSAFRARVQSCISDLSSHEKESRIAVFTSATPIAIMAAAALGLTEEKMFSFLGVIYNTS